MNEFLKDIWYFICRYLLIFLPDRQFARINLWISYKRFGIPYRGLNLKNPATFTEKINYLKLSDECYKYEKFADKYLVRQFVSEEIGAQYLVPLLGIYKRADEIDFNLLPDRFILKTNHGSGWNILCEDKKSLNLKKARRLLSKWLLYNAYYLSREKQVKNIKPLIICEELLDYNINDFKFFCHNGEPFIVQVDIGRFTNHKRAFYNMTWTKQDFSFVYPIYSEDIPPPEKFEEMKEVAKKLSKQFKFSRIDLYIHQAKVYFGEITFFPEGGSGYFIPPEYDMIMGNFINL